MANKEHQHFIPRTYLKRFAHRNDGDTYFVDTLDVNSKEIKEDLAVSNLCVDCDLYTLNNVPDDKKYQIEDFFNNEIESDYTEVYNLLTNDSIEFITPDQRVKIIKTLLSMYFRTPKTLNKFIISSGELLKELKTKDKGKISFMGIDFDLENQSLKEIKKEIRETAREYFIKIGLVLMAEFMKLRAFDGIVVIKLIGDQEFITSDNPVTISNTQAQLLNLFSIYNSIYVPINPKYCVFIAPSSEKVIVNRIFRNQDNFIQNIILNDSTYSNAERWIIGTKKGIVKFKTDHEEFSQPADDNHPIIKEAEENLKIMMELAHLAELGAKKKDLSEYVKYVKEHQDDIPFKKHVAFVKVVEQLKAQGLI